MSIKTIKTTLENHLKLNLANIAIKWNNTSYYSKNNAPLGQAEIDALTFFVEPKIIAISDERELISSGSPFKTEIFLQIDIYNKINQGTGAVYSTIETLNSMFREQIISGVVCERVNTIGSFIDGEWTITPHRVKCYFWN